MFGSGDPGLEQIRMINAVRGLELRDSTKELILSRNALEFLGLEKDLRWTMIQIGAYYDSDQKV